MDREFASWIDLLATTLPSLEANSTATRRLVAIVLLNEVVAAPANSAL